MEKDNGFTESTIDKDGKRNKFFFLGPKNNWKDKLNKDFMRFSLAFKMSGKLNV